MFVFGLPSDTKSYSLHLFWESFKNNNHLRGRLSPDISHPYQREVIWSHANGAVFTFYLLIQFSPRSVSFLYIYNKNLSVSSRALWSLRAAPLPSVPSWRTQIGSERCGGPGSPPLWAGAWETSRAARPDADWVWHCVQEARRSFSFALFFPSFFHK